MKLIVLALLIGVATSTKVTQDETVSFTFLELCR